MEADGPDTPRIVVLSQLYPHSGQAQTGLFVRERMARVAQHLPLVVVSPVAWFPLQGAIRHFRPHFRPPGPRHEQQRCVDVYCPRWLSFPGVFKALDGWLLAISLYPFLRRLQKRWPFDILDAHFGYPDGYAAVLLARWLSVRVTVTLRGNESRRIESPYGLRQIGKVVRSADRVFTVSSSLKEVALRAGAAPGRAQVVANGVDSDRFQPANKQAARRQYGLAADPPVLVTVGTLVQRKGFHRVIEVLPRLQRTFPDIQYLVVGGAGAEGDCGPWLKRLAQQCGVEDAVHFLGAVQPDELRVPLSAADVFVLATSGEGWANVLLEAMACGLPVVATDVGGNGEVVKDDTLGRIVQLGDSERLADALIEVLRSRRNPEGIRHYALDNGWDQRITDLVAAFRQVHGGSAASVAARGAQNHDLPLS